MSLLSEKAPEWESWIFESTEPYFEKPRLQLEKTNPKKRTFLIFHKTYMANITIDLEASELEISTSVEQHEEVKPLADLIAQARPNFNVVLST